MGPSMGQQRVLPALEALVASREEQEAQHLALEAWAASLEEQEERRQALEAWAASLEVLEEHQWVALAALAVGREALVVVHRSS